MMNYKKLSAVEIVKNIKQGAFTAQEITREALNLAQAIGRDLNAFISICEDKALLQAETIDEKVKNGNCDNLPLAGVPVAIKDNICYKDYPTTCGSHILENFIPPYNATCVEKLINAGAVIIGKTNMDEFAMGSSSENSYFGAVKNPWGDNLVPGGSSGGSVSAVAAGVVPLAFGSDTGGSIRQPASFCGVYGFKPTYGSISRYGLVAFGSSLDQIGPIARDIKDIALSYDVVCGRDPHDSTSVNINHPHYSELLKTDKKFTIGLPKEFISEGLDSGVQNVMERVINILTENGHTLVDISFPM
ncbi:MAG: Asp-tRNA(Asn)/Glu-tRNA(Gln) amidotransferase subunit GatA, partial [FCB group bacterium]|nr:Asp-tRNA(Asn)/Glu-tRNA(Gln) amidotransferase subunit GatA [FCB group bacterium]